MAETGQWPHRDRPDDAGDHAELRVRLDQLVVVGGTTTGRHAEQRQESARAYEEGGRLDLATQERQEIDIIREYLPRQMTDTEVEKAIAAAIAETGASSIRDMGKVMATLKARHTGKMDFSRAGAAIKQAFR